MKAVNKSEFFKLDRKDKIRTVFMTMSGAFIGVIFSALQNGLALNKEVIISAVVGACTAGLPYLTKNTLTNSEDNFLKVEKKVLQNSSRKVNKELIKKLRG